MITHYCRSLEDAQKKTKLAGKQPGYDYWGITLPNGKRGFAVYKNGNLVERDALGNLTNDGRKGLVISYNVLNLPRVVTSIASGSLAYTYLSGQFNFI